MADPKWRLCDSNVEFFEQLTQNLLYGYFWVADYDSEVRIGKFKIWCQNCKIRNGGSKMAAILVKILIFFASAPKLGIWGFSGSLITNLVSEL